MKTSTILKYAKRILATKYSEHIRFTKHQYICHAIDDVSQTYMCWAKARAITMEIQRRLEGYYSLENWLRSVHNIHSSDYDRHFPDEFGDKVQTTRHAWIDSMIAEFQAKGD